MLKKLVLIATVPLILALLTTPALCQKHATPMEGEMARDFSFKYHTSGEMSTLADSKGEKATLLIFIQTACRPCLREMTAVREMLDDIEGLSVLCVFVDISPKTIERYLKNNELTLPTTWDYNEDISKLYNITFTPTTYLLDKEMKIVKRYKGFHRGAEKPMLADIEELVGL